MDWMDHWDWGGWGCMDITEMQKKIKCIDDCLEQN
jgi:hypothetical protein